MHIQTIIRRSLLFLVPLIIIVGLLTQITLADIVGLLADLSYGWVSLGVLCYLATNMFRARRLQVLLPGTSIWNVTTISIVQSMFNNILPARMGEFSLLYLLSRYERVSLDRSVVALIIARLFDYIVVAVLFVIAAALSLSSLPSGAAQIVGVVGAFLLLISVIALSMVQVGEWGLAWLTRLLQWLGIADWKWVTFGLTQAQKIVSALMAMNSPWQYLRVFGWSLCVWVMTFLWFYAFLRSMDIHTQLYQMIVGATFAVLSKAIPFISIGGLGAHEAGWTLGFILIGFDSTLAIASGFAVNILTLLTSVVLGSLALLWLRQTCQGSPAPDPDTETTEATSKHTHRRSFCFLGRHNK